VKQEVVTIFRLLDPKRTGYVKLTKLLKFIMDQKAAAKKQ
jgi:Ca2+-binding EF-hand superfamily protein